MTKRCGTEIWSTDLELLHSSRSIFSHSFFFFRKRQILIFQNKLPAKMKQDPNEFLVDKWQDSLIKMAVQTCYSLSAWFITWSIRHSIHHPSHFKPDIPKSIINLQYVDRRGLVVLLFLYFTGKPNWWLLNLCVGRVCSHIQIMEIHLVK